LLGPPLTLIFSLITLIDLILVRRAPEKAMVWPATWSRSMCVLAGVKVRIEGLEKIDPKKTYIFAGNHVSQFDIYCFQGYFPHNFRWIAKKELFAIPVFGLAMRKAGLIPIDRSRGRQAMVSLGEAAHKIAQGTSVIIFPEGTRSMDGQLQPFKSGAGLLAIKSGIDVVPIAFKGTHQVLPKKKLLPKSGWVIIRVGDPIKTSNYESRDKQELITLLHQRVADLLDKPVKSQTQVRDG
jgi:1-acyl-sn-glycerol-3-phosphate acyltransferase